jgi:hypothetical protein
LKCDKVATVDISQACGTDDERQMPPNHLLNYFCNFIQKGTNIAATPTKLSSGATSASDKCNELKRLHCVEPGVSWGTMINEVDQA